MSMTNAPETASAVVVELRNHLNDALAAHSLATLGLSHMRTQLQQSATTAAPNASLLLGHGIPVGENPPRFAELPITTAIYQLRQEGEVENRLAQQWIVAFFSAWNEEFRPRLATAHRCRPEDIAIDVFGDLRWMRNDIVHEGAQASLAATGRCKVLTWFRPPHFIRPTMRQLASLWELIPWADLEQGPWPRT